MALVILFLFLVFMISPIIALIAIARANTIERRLQESIDDLRRQVATLSERLLAVQRTARREGTAPAAASEAATVAAAPPIPTPPVTEPSVPVAPPVVAPPVAALPTTTAPPVTEPPVAAPPPVATPPIAPPPVEAQPVAAPPVVSPSVAAPPMQPPPPRPRAPRPPLPPPPPPPPPQPAFWQNIDWEGIVGVKLFSAIAGIALALAGVFFLKFSIDHGWLQPPVRVAIGILTGTALLALCEMRVAQRYRITANALDAGALALLFATFFAAHSLWNLIGTLPTFALLGMVTSLAVYLSVRRDSMFIAVLGLLGGFATPALLGSGHDNPIGLFGYLLLLNAGLSWIAYMKRWPALTALSLLLTTSYQWAWIFKFLTVQKLPLAAGIFLIFPILSFLALVLSRRLPGSRRARTGTLLDAGDGGEDGDEDDNVPWLMRFGPTAALSAALPLLLATYLAAVPEFGAQYWLLFGFLLCLAVGLFAVAMMRSFYVLHFVGGLSAVMVTLVWLGLSYRPTAYPDVLGIFAIFILFYLAAPIVADRLGRALGEPATRAHLASALFFAFFAALARLDPGRDSLPLLFGSLFALLAITGGYAILRGPGGGGGLVYFVAAFFAVAAEAAWSTRYLTPERLFPALMLYAAFGLLYLGVPELARRLRRPLEPEGAGGWLLLASLGLLFFLASPHVAASALWGIGVLLAILNAGLFVESLAARRPWQAIAGVALSWLVLGVWWLTVPLQPVYVSAIVVLVGYALLVFAGMHWIAHRATASHAPSAAPGSSLLNAPAMAFVAYLFLAFAAMNYALAVTPLPIFAALIVVGLTVIVTTLRQMRGDLHLAATVCCAIVLLLWTATTTTMPVLEGFGTPRLWIFVSIGAVLTLLASTVVTYAISERRGPTDTMFAAAVIAAAFLGHFTLIFDSVPPNGRDLAWAASPVHIACIASILVVGWREGWSKLPLYSVGLSSLVLVLVLAPLDAQRLPMQHLILATAIYACYIAYPIVLGERVRGTLVPYLTAAIASGVFFFLARFDLINAGYAKFIAVLPVAQALIMGGLVWILLRIEPAGRRTLGRLALTAGTALAFVTVAIPLQFEKEWLTLGWALEAAALAWLYRRIPHRGLLIATAGLALVVFVRLSANPDVFLYSPRSGQPILNWYLYTYTIASAAFFAAARLLYTTQDRLLPALPRLSTLLPAGATILLFDLLNIEIADFYSIGPTLTFRFSATLAQDLTYTLGWLVFAVALLAAGIILVNRAARIAALGLMVATILKCFLHDLGRLGGLYRVGAFVGLALCLTLVAVALQRFVLTTPRQEPQSES